MSYAEEIKRAVSMEQVANLYGLTINHAGFARCPFHRERTASFKVYPGDGGYHCFGCGRSGDVITFVRDMDGCGFMEACEKLNREFLLGLPIGEKLSRRKLEAAAQKDYMRRRQREAAQMAADNADREYWRAYDAWLANQNVIDANTPASPSEPINEAYAQAVGREALLTWELEQADIKRQEIRKNH